MYGIGSGGIKFSIRIQRCYRGGVKGRPPTHLLFLILDVLPLLGGS